MLCTCATCASCAVCLYTCACTYLLCTCATCKCPCMCTEFFAVQRQFAATISAEPHRAWLGCASSRSNRCRICWMRPSRCTLTTLAFCCTEGRCFNEDGEGTSATTGSLHHCLSPIFGGATVSMKRTESPSSNPGGVIYAGCVLLMHKVYIGCIRDA